MVIGNGLIANAFESYKTREDTIIFASGVSNSSIPESDSSFERENNLLDLYLSQSEKKLIYFSTCSIFDGSKITPYINHKIEIEEKIKKNSENFLIFRLPIVIGISENKNTFFNSIAKRIIEDGDISIYRNASRYIIDVDDLSNILPSFIDGKDSRKEINVCFENRESVENLVYMIERNLGKTSKKTFVETNQNIPIDNSHFLGGLKSIGYSFDESYNEKVIKKYCDIIR